MQNPEFNRIVELSNFAEHADHSEQFIIYGLREANHLTISLVAEDEVKNTIVGHNMYDVMYEGCNYEPPSRIILNIALESTMGPLFLAQEALCIYPISTIYGACPRYLFYSLLVISCVTRWRGWLADVFLGTAATYAGVAAVQSFILISSSTKNTRFQPVTIPYIPDNTTLSRSFPRVITQTDQIFIQPAAIDLDGDAVLAIVITGYLVFVPLQCWSRVLTNERARNVLFYMWNALMFAASICALVNAARKKGSPTQYMFCFPNIPPYSPTSNDGWQSSWRSSSWNTSVWETFSNSTRWGETGDICFNPCFNTTQILRQPETLQSYVATKELEYSHSNRFSDKIVYSNRYIYSLIILCVILNLIQLTFKFLPYKSRIPSAQIIVIWKERKTIWKSFKCEMNEALSKSTAMRKSRRETYSTPKRTWNCIRTILTVRFLKTFLHVLVDAFILFGLLFSMIISPLTVIAFVIWIEWWIYQDGPSQENPQQVGQWCYLVSIALLLISAAVLTMKYKLASVAELDSEIAKLRLHLSYLEQKRHSRLESDTSLLGSAA